MSQSPLSEAKTKLNGLQEALPQDAAWIGVAWESNEYDVFNFNDDVFQNEFPTFEPQYVSQMSPLTP